MSSSPQERLSESALATPQELHRLVQHAAAALLGSRHRPKGVSADESPLYEITIDPSALLNSSIFYMWERATVDFDTGSNEAETNTDPSPPALIFEFRGRETLSERVVEREKLITVVDAGEATAYALVDELPRQHTYESTFLNKLIILGRQTIEQGALVTLTEVTELERLVKASL